jgi:hypothetical protein
MISLDVIFRSDQPARLSNWDAAAEFAKGQNHPATCAAGELYFASTHGDAIDSSFAVSRNDEPLLLVKCNVFEEKLGYFGRPITLLARDGISQESYEASVNLALTTLDRIARQGRAGSVRIRDEISSPELGYLARKCSVRGASAEVVQTARCDLAMDEDQIHRNIRKSFKSLVNWGRRNLILKYFSGQNPDIELFEAYRRFHAEVAGRLTRPEQSWRAMRDWISAGGGELALAYLSTGELVAGTMTTDGAESAVYASGVYDRARFDKPIAHFPVYDAILRSRKRGLRYFELGDLPAMGTVSDKEYNIGFFKRGFASSICMHLVWRYEISEASTPDLP